MELFIRTHVNQRTFEHATSIAVLQTEILVAPDSPLHDGSPPTIFPRTPYPGAPWAGLSGDSTWDASAG